MNMSFSRKVAGAFAGTLLTMSIATSGSAAPLSVAAPALVAPQTQIVDARYVRHRPVVRRYGHFPGIGRVIGGLLAFGLGAAFRPSCDYYYYYDGYPYYCGPYYGGPYYSGPYYSGPSYYRYGYRPAFRGFAAGPGGFRGNVGGFRGGGGGFRGAGHHR